ncbi:MAG: outer membrane protein transport protein [Ghiorsea sp.]|nr:outer membrane protein transport protein [Ghiorsea sp.]
MNRIIIVSAASLLLSSQVFASGFMIPEQGAKAMGMGNAFGAIADDASANWFNPAGLSFQENNASVSSTLVYPLNDFETGGQTYSAKKGLHVIPQAYMRYGDGNSDVSYGLGINSPFGLSVDWTGSGAPFTQTAAAGKAVTFSEIQAVHVNPNIAYRVSENLSIAAGIAYYNAFKVHLNSDLLRIGGSGDGFGGNFAFMYNTSDWSVGGSYRTKVKIDITGTAVGGPDAAVLGLEGIGANATTSVTFPDIHSLSFAYRGMPHVILSAQLDRVNWATFDKIEVNYAPSALDSLTGSSSTIPEGWKATVAVRLGAEWAYDEHSRARAGYTYDPTPTNPTDFSPRLPGNDRQLVTLGYGLDLSNELTMDLAYAYVWLDDRTATAPTDPAYHGVFKSTVHLLSGGLTYKY